MPAPTREEVNDDDQDTTDQAPTEIRNFLKVKWEGIKGLSQTYILHFGWS